MHLIIQEIRDDDKSFGD